MDEDWTPLLNKDCMLFSPGSFSTNDDFHLTNFDYNTDVRMVKKEVKTEASAFERGSEKYYKGRLIDYLSERSGEFVSNPYQLNVAIAKRHFDDTSLWGVHYQRDSNVGTEK
ncbi:hypothetical protein KIN20_005205 [Parelaphostrongylus tenuis]|uniref:Uncharacterized protein n=1 Tax=Parelaphostrongylus tenuis TaxID=148309 RepID=A0AAD5MI32_PARTN|nr:hypothetical protein KIN20_005205 [Parelaphostrongylus tenuis]